MSNTELVAELRGHAERFNYDGWIDTAIWFEQAADAIEQLEKKATEIVAITRIIAAGPIGTFRQIIGDGQR